jgi:hypothetical protein
MTWSLLKAILLLFFCSSKFIGTAQIKPKLKSGEKWENFYEKVPVSGEIRVGAMGFESDEKVAPTIFFVRIPKHNMNTMCVEISSRDGRYEARLPYTISSLKEGIYQFELPTQYVSDLKNYSIKDIAILAKIGRDCESSESYYVVSSWNKPPENPPHIFIYLNSDKPVFFRFKRLKDNEIINIECKPINAPISVAYNCKCEISAKDIQGVTDFYIRQRVRRINDISFNNYSFPFKF